MQISHDYVTRFLGTSVQAPRNKPDVTDDVFSSVVNSSGGHQLMIDCSRCVNVQQFDCLASCRSLLYLDLSFTSFSNLSSIANNCSVLKALNVAHTQIVDFSPIQELVTLEVLNLRHTSFSDCSLLQPLQILRSLDMGETAIRTIGPLVHMYRLEELLLDRCAGLLQTKDTIETSILDMMDEHEETLKGTELRACLMKLSGLRLLNVSEIGASDDWMDAYLALSHEEICIESKSRREQFLEAILANDPVHTRRLLQSGISVDIVMEEWAEKILSTTWRTKCKHGSHTAPYFIMNHPDKSLRPRAIHVAIYFNRQKALKPLIEMNVDMTSRVWMSDVRDIKGQIVIHEKKVKRPEACVIKTPYFPMECADKGVYNFTEGMIQSSETKWRALSAEIQEQINVLFLGRWFRDEIMRPQSHAGDDKEIAMVAATFAANDIASLAAAKLVLESTDLTDEMKTSMESGTKNDEGEHLIPEMSEMIVNGQQQQGGEELTSQSTAPLLLSTKQPRKQKQKSTIAPKPERPDWRVHSLVAKILGPPTIMKSSITRKDVKLLGKKSYWLESRKWAGEEVAAKEAILAKAALDARTAEQTLLAEKRKIVSLATPSVEDSLVPEHKSRYDLPIDPSVQQFALPGHAVIKPIAARRKEMRELLNQKLHVDIDV